MSCRGYWVIEDINKKLWIKFVTVYAKLILGRWNLESSNDALRNLNGLAIRIQLKTLCLIHRSLYKNAPEYLSSLVKTIKKQFLTYASKLKNILKCHTQKKIIPAWSISVKGPELWINLPFYLKSTQDRNKFKEDLETYLFKICI